MSNKSNEFGRAFEYACITSLSESIKDQRTVYIVKDTAYNNTNSRTLTKKALKQEHNL